jgi:hypothetical protein
MLLAGLFRLLNLKEIEDLLLNSNQFFDFLHLHDLVGHLAFLEAMWKNDHHLNVPVAYFVHARVNRLEFGHRVYLALLHLQIFVVRAAKIYLDITVFRILRR